jgi:hypothetical protein
MTTGAYHVQVSFTLILKALVLKGAGLRAGRSGF